MKKITLILIFIIACPFFVFGCSTEKINLNEYFIEVNYDNISQTAKASERVVYFNSSQDELSNICFHLYPNAFREDVNKKLITPSNFNKAYPNGMSGGGINIEGVKISEYDVNFEIIGEDQNILNIILPEKLGVGQNIEISIDFNLILPNINHRFGYGNNTVNFGNFYPIACVYEEGEFKQDLYSSNGDPFYSECSNYFVDVSYSSEYILASTGEEIAREEKEGVFKSKIEARRVRDFCFVLSTKFKLLEQQEGNTRIKYYYYNDESPQDSMSTAVKAMKTFNTQFGEYPYSQYSVVECNFVYGGMEYPNLVMISDCIPSKEDYQYVIVHETAHQWWYGLVGNNEYENAWMDEGLAEYSSALFYAQNREYAVNYNAIVKNAERNFEIFIEVYKDVFGEVDTSMNRRLDEYKTEPEYLNCTYVKGLLLFNEIKNSVGDNKMKNLLRKYFEEKKYKNTSYAEFLNIFSKNGGINVKNIIEKYVE